MLRACPAPCIPNPAPPVTLTSPAPSRATTPFATANAPTLGPRLRYGRTNVIVTECSVVVAFVIAAAIATAVTPWLLVAIYLGHGTKDLWQHRTHFVRGTRWWPPFCFAIDMTVALVIAAQILLGAQFQQ